MQRPAKPCTPVRSRPPPPVLLDLRKNSLLLSGLFFCLSLPVTCAEHTLNRFTCIERQSRARSLSWPLVDQNDKCEHLPGMDGQYYSSLNTVRVARNCRKALK